LFGNIAYVLLADDEESISTSQVSGTVDVPEGWRVESFWKVFDFHVPPDFFVVTRAFEDAIGVLYEGAGLRLQINHGIYSSPLSRFASTPEFDLKSTTIGGKSCELATMKPPGAEFELDPGYEYAVLVRFPKMGREPLIVGGREKAIDIVANCKTKADTEIALQIIRSIRFPE